MSHQLRRTALLVPVTAALLGLAACGPTSSSGSSAGSAAASAPASASGTPIPGANAGTAGLPNGNKLNTMLLPASALPQTLRLDPSGTKSTGDGFNPPVSPSPVAAPKACDMLNQTNWSDAGGGSYASFAQNDYMDDSQDMFAQDVSAYRGNDAAAVMANLKQVLVSCHTFTTSVNGQNLTETTTLKPVSGLGDDALEAVITSPDLSGGVTLVAARVNNIVVSTLDNTVKDGEGAGSAGVALTKTLVQNVTTGVAAH
jgi:hypothetical protein